VIFSKPNTIAQQPCWTPSRKDEFSRNVFFCVTSLCMKRVVSGITEVSTFVLSIILWVFNVSYSQWVQRLHSPNSKG